MQGDKKKPIGALWSKSKEKYTTEGRAYIMEYLTGNIEIDGRKVDIVVFKSQYKKDRQPDYRIFESEKREQRTEQPRRAPIDDQDIPF